jgi:Ser-tRNA(Ala) deacylase AlaX
VESILNSIILRLCNDAKVRIRRSVIDVLSDLAERTVQEMILLPVASDILKQKAVTQKIPRELRNLLSVYYTGEHLIRTLMDKFFDALISEFMMVTDAKYNDLASMLLDPKFPIV